MKPITPPPAVPDPWRRLVVAARSAAPPPSPELEGFSARVVSRWLSPRPSFAPAALGLSQLWEAWTLRALAAAGAVTLAALAWNFQALREDVDPEAISLDPVAELVASL